MGVKTIPLSFFLYTTDSSGLFSLLKMDFLHIFCPPAYFLKRYLLITLPPLMGCFSLSQVNNRYQVLQYFGRVASTRFYDFESGLWGLFRAWGT